MQIVCIALLVAVCGASAAPQDPYEFGFDAGSHFRQETHGEDGITRGRYGFRTPDGCMHVVRYQTTARGGYRVLGSSKENCTTKVRRPHTRFTTTKLPTTTTTPRPTTTTTTTTTPRPTTTTTTTPRPDPLTLRPVPIVDNAIEETKPIVVVEVPQGRQLRRPNLTTQRPAPTTTTPKPKKDEPEPTYTFGFEAPSHGHTEAGLPDGSKKGEYYWDSPDGWRRIVTYVANKKGFFPKMRRVRIPTTTTTTPAPPEPVEEPKVVGKELGGTPQIRGGCPYFFYYNTRINYHWERCMENNQTKVGEFGHLADDGYEHRTAYYADATGFHPKISKTLQTEKQRNAYADFTSGAYIVPKPEEERRSTEKRILKWMDENRERLANPLA